MLLDKAVNEGLDVDDGVKAAVFPMATGELCEGGLHRDEHEHYVGA